MKIIVKHIHILSIIILAVGIGFSGCKKDYGEIGDVSSKVKAIKGTWKAEKVIQLDYIAIEKGNDLYQWNVSTAPGLNLTAFTINFQENGQFAIEANGAHNFAKVSSGTWAFDNNDYPSKINLTNGTLTDAFAVIAPPKEGFDNFIISYDRYSGGKKILGYQYYLKKQ